MSQQKIRVGVVGVGYGAYMHIPGLQAYPDTEALAVCSARQERAEAAAKKYGIPHVFTDYRKMLELDELDAVFIATPPHLHYPVTMAALEAGKHVLCEKPMAMNVDEAREMYQEAETRKLVHMIGHQFRFLPGRALMKELAAEGYVGQLYSVHSSTFYGPKNGGPVDHLTIARPFDSRSDKSQGGGFLGLLGSHVIDALRDWFGEMAGVYGQLETLAKTRKIEGSDEVMPVETDDLFAFIFRFETGVLGTVAASFAARLTPGTPGMSSFEVYGSEGSLFLGTDGILRGGQRGDSEATELPIPERLKLPPTEGHWLLPAFLRLVQEFVHGIKEGKKVAPNFYDGMKNQEVMDAILLAQSQGQWVNLPLKAGA